ncbi:hypothetical protein CDAR_243391 [Caerostris darwini]|uniref:Uncharacterized protein n=1 Tax=Caerostris darwini TaxID=1538125 RepID=A0AAV4RBA9_9ARAC|nr:hypothetical protein CDAR_243391 [Caerostris darwini]
MVLSLMLLTTTLTGPQYLESVTLASTANCWRVTTDDLSLTMTATRICLANLMEFQTRYQYERLLVVLPYGYKYPFSTIKKPTQLNKISELSDF